MAVVIPLTIGPSVGGMFWLPARLRGISVPVSATLAPLSTLFLRLLSPVWPIPREFPESRPPRALEFLRLDASTGERSP